MINRAKKYALYALGRKSLTSKELYDKLCAKGYEAAADEILYEFQKAGYLNDAEYARMYIIDGINLSCKGGIRLRRELFAKGIDASVVDPILEDTEEDAFRVLLSYVRLRYDKEDLSDFKMSEKIKAQLLRRGFSYSEIRRCFDEIEWSED